MPAKTCRRLLLLALLCACTEEAKKDTKSSEPPLVRTTAAELRQVQREIRTTGFLESEHQDQIASAVGGKLLAVEVDEGSVVTKGMTLAVIDSREVTSMREQLTVQRDGKKVDQDLANLEVEAAGRRVEQARLEKQKAKSEFDRQSQMNVEFVSPKALQDAEVAYQSAEESFKVAEFNERKSKLEVIRIGSLVAELDAKVRELDVRIEHHTITAPFAGVITRRHVVGGATIAAGSVLFDTVDPDHLVAWLDRPQSELDIVRQAKKVTFKTDALPGREFAAEIDLISPVVDRQSGHFRLRMRVHAADCGTLVHGMFVRARILAEDLREALLVPKAGVLSEGDTSIVMVVRGGKATRVDLDPGLELQDWIECKNRGPAGLQPGELVITSGHEDLKDQTAVAVQQPTAAPTAAPGGAANAAAGGDATKAAREADVGSPNAASPAKTAPAANELTQPAGKKG